MVFALELLASIEVFAIFPFRDFDLVGTRDKDGFELGENEEEGESEGLPEGSDDLDGLSDGFDETDGFDDSDGFRDGARDKEGDVDGWDTRAFKRFSLKSIGILCLFMKST